MSSVVRTRRWWTLLVVCAPMPVTLLLCNGLVPPAALAGIVVLQVNHGSTALNDAKILGLQLAVQILGLNWLARLIASRLAPRTQAMLAIALIVLAIAPVYYFDCMDGSPVVRCSIPDLISAGLTNERQCGDMGW